MFNRNPPKPRHVSISDIEQLLIFVRGMPNNTELSDRNINLKLVILLFLTSARRCHEICYLNIKFMVRTLSSFKFCFYQSYKKLEERETSTMLEVSEYSDGEKLCAVSCFAEHFGRSVP